MHGVTGYTVHTDEGVEVFTLELLDPNLYQKLKWLRTLQVRHRHVAMVGAAYQLSQLTCVALMHLEHSKSGIC